MREKSRFPDWKTIYDTEPVESMAWYCRELDKDLKESLDELAIRGGKFLDIGTGPGTQALELSHRGFKVTGTDLSRGAVERCSKLSRDIEFIEDDITRSRLRGSWDYAFDRGCFHCLEPKDRAQYVETLARVLNPHGVLFLKTFSWKQEDWGYGPYRFTAQDIRELFSSHFELISEKETEYQGTLPQNPKALFCVLKRK